MYLSFIKLALITWKKKQELILGIHFIQVDLLSDE